MTLAFFYLLVFLLGFTLALVTGLVRRILHPSQLCDGIVLPSAEHWASLRTPRADVIVSFFTMFGLVSLILHGTTEMSPAREILVAAAVGTVGALALRAWLCKACDPRRGLQCEGATAVVVRRIPEGGFGQIEVDVGGCRVKLAARSHDGSAVENGVPVKILDRHESVVIVEVCP